MKKIIITGANGYIGSCLFYILKKKFKVIGIDKKKSSNKIINQCYIIN
jgi:dTDP-4-dehydrorhamnose reductase